MLNKERCNRLSFLCYNDFGGTMELEKLYKKYDKLQKQHGAKELHAIYHGGCFSNPKVCFVFMNPTGRNVASDSSWPGIRAPWIGTKIVWQLFYQIGLFDEELYQEIQNRKPKEWTPEFSKKVYDEVASKGYFITNLGKCTQIDARPLPDSVYLEYLHLLKEEIRMINPDIIVTFGNQVSSILLDEKVSVTEWRKKYKTLKIKDKEYKTYPVFYPVGNGRFNMPKSIEDLKYIFEENGLFQEKVR